MELFEIMGIQSFVCKHCGAEVELGAKGKIATCRYCGGKYDISFSDGSFSADPVDKDIDSRVKKLIDDKKELEDRLKRIDEGNKKWEQFLSSFYAGKAKNAPEMKILYEEAKSDFMLGYGMENRKLISKYCNINYLNNTEDTVSTLGCDLIVIVTIIAVCILGVICIRIDNKKLGMILLSSGFALFLFLLLGTLGVRGEKKENENREKAKKRLLEIEKEMRKRLDNL